MRLPPSEYRRTPWLRRVAPPVGLLVLGGILYGCGFRLEGLSDQLRQTGAWAPVLFGAVGVLAMTMFIPKTWVSLAAGALLGTMVGCVTMLLTAVAAAALNYGIGRFWLGNSNLPAVDEVDSSRTLMLETVRRVAHQAGFGTHLMIRLSPIPTSVISYSMGAARAQIKPYLSAAAVAVIPQWLYVHAAALGANDQATDTYRQVSFAISIGTAVLVSIALPRIAIQRWKESRDSFTSEAGRS